jgi:hypothetical protein
MNPIAVKGFIATKDGTKLLRSSILKCHPHSTSIPTAIEKQAARVEVIRAFFMAKKGNHFRPQKAIRTKQRMF